MPRPRLAARLERERPWRVGLVTAPAGYGKTTLVGEWARAETAPVGWLSIDRFDNDLERLSAYLELVVGDVRDRLEDRAREAGRARGPAAVRLAALYDRLETLTGDFAIVLDDTHRLVADDALAAVEVLAERLPPRGRLVLVGRARPRLALGRRRLAGELEEIDAADLAFSARETARFFARAAGLALTARQAAAIDEWTEGWAAALQLVALALAGGDAAGRLDGLLDSRPGEGRIFDFLAEEIVDRLPPELRVFLLETSILERLCAPLCAAVTGAAASPELLREAARSNLFLFALEGDERRWYRYHRLFRRFLGSRLAEDRRERIAELHLRAAEWLESEAQWEAAIRHAAAGGDRRRTARLLDRVRGLLPGGATLGAAAARDHVAPPGAPVFALAAEELLSAREREVLRSLARGLSDKEIARGLGIGLTTVKTHLRHVYAKLEVPSRTRAVRRAFELGLVDDGPETG